MAEAFKTSGFKTAGFVSSIVLSAQSGLARGFDDFSDRFDLGADAADEGHFLDILEKRGDVTVAEAVKWLDGHATDRTFMWVHLYDPHAPYEPPEPYASRYADRPYDGEVAWSDELVGRLDAASTRLGIRDQTLTVADVGPRRVARRARRVGARIFSLPGDAQGAAAPEWARRRTGHAYFRCGPERRSLSDRPRSGRRGAASVDARGCGTQPRPQRARDVAGPRRHAVVRRIADAAHSLRMERPEECPRRPLEIHPRPEGGALRPLE